MNHIVFDKNPSFWRKTNQWSGDKACYIWQGPVNLDGYGLYKGKYAHRLAFELSYGVIPVGLQVNHKCNCPSCCNPTHLYAGTQAENMRDKSVAGRVNRRNKFLTFEEAQAARAAFSNSRQAAEALGVSRSHARNILNGTRWGARDKRRAS